MTILSACQSAALRIIGRRPASAFSNQGTDAQTMTELVDLANDIALEIARSHDWQALTKIHTLDGDGEAKQFPLPADYDRMLLASEIIDPSTWFWGYCHIPTVTEWLMEESYGWQRITPGAWIILANQFNFVPAPSSGASAKFPYITNLIVKPASGDNKAAFTTDTDTFLLDERLLTLGLIWRWKEQKSLEYAEDLQTYENALSERQAKDSGARVIRAVSRRGGALRLSPAWPWSLG